MLSNNARFIMKIKSIFIILALMLFGATMASAEADGYIVKFKTVPSGLDTAIFEEIIPEEGLYRVESLDSISGYQDYIQFTEADAPVEIHLPNAPQPKVSLMSIPDDNIYPEQWALNMIKAEFAWENETYGNEIRVAVIDSGCYPHGDLGDNLLEGKNYLDNTTDTSDDHGHGTHVAGIIAAGMNGRGTVGVAPKAKIVPIKIMNQTDSCTMSKVARAIRDCVDVFGCRVINMSWGIPSKNSTLKSALDHAYKKGVILVSAVGNDGIADLSYPAAFDNVIGVGAVDETKLKSSFSRFNESVDIMAPGTKILSTFLDNQYAYMDGTSQASPHIAAIAALALSAEPELTNGEFYSILTETAEDLGDEGKDTFYGCGLVDTQALFGRIFQKKDYYISPTNIQDGKSFYLVRNTSDAPLTLDSYFAKYDGERLVSATRDAITLNPHQAVTFVQVTSRHFLWDNMSPLK